MGRSSKTSAITDGLLKFAAVSGTISLTLLAPNVLIALDKPLKAYFDSLDKRAADREYARLIQNMKRQGLIKASSNDYEHGLQITAKGKERLERVRIESLIIQEPTKWDHKWRLIFYDIPESNKNGRDTLTRKLQALGFRQLQRSVWIHPYPCRHEIEAITSSYGISDFVSYIETTYIDNDGKLIQKFKHLNLA